MDKGQSPPLVVAHDNGAIVREWMDADGRTHRHILAKLSLVDSPELRSILEQTVRDYAASVR